MRGTAARTIDRLSHDCGKPLANCVVLTMGKLGAVLTLVARAGGSHALPPLAGKGAKMLGVAPNRKRLAEWGKPLPAPQSPKERGPETKCQQNSRIPHEAQASLALHTTMCKLSVSMPDQSRPTLPRSSRRPLRLDRVAQWHCFRNPLSLPATDLPPLAGNAAPLAANAPLLFLATAAGWLRFFRGSFGGSGV